MLKGSGAEVKAPNGSSRAGHWQWSVCARWRHARSHSVDERTDALDDLSGQGTDILARRMRTTGGWLGQDHEIRRDLVSAMDS